MSNIMKQFDQWYSRNQDAVTWFLIGALVTSGIDAFSHRDYFWAAWNLSFAFINYKLIPVRV